MTFNSLIKLIFFVDFTNQNPFNKSHFTAMLSLVFTSLVLFEEDAAILLSVTMIDIQWFFPEVYLYK